MAGDFEPSVADAMKIGAETARHGKRIGGLDGGGWVNEIRLKPMVTLPPGAGALVVAYFDAKVTTFSVPPVVVNARLCHFCHREATPAGLMCETHTVYARQWWHKMGGAPKSARPSTQLPKDVEAAYIVWHDAMYPITRLTPTTETRP